MEAENNLIFVSIAAYRDRQLVPTVEDCVAKASAPERLRFGICWQHGAEETSLPFGGDVRIQVLDVDWRDSRGVCWARAEIQKLYRGEQWFLQVDSHCRFAQGWDDKLIAAVAAATLEYGSLKPILSTYGTEFTPGDPATGLKDVLKRDPLVITYVNFSEEGLPELKSEAMPDWRRRTFPLRSRFLGAGFLFTTGRFVEEVPYDPQLYFHGEEVSMTVRAYTSGYDLFHPSEPIVWHDYVRTDATRHWDNHTTENVEREWVKRDWDELDTASQLKVRGLLTGEPVAGFGLGTARTIEDYERYAGVSFQHCKIQDYTRRALEPPNPEIEPDWPDHIYQWMARIRVDFLDLPDGALGDPSFWSVGIIDKDHTQLYLRAFSAAELKTVTGEEDEIILVCEFQSGTIPFSWVVQPFSRSAGWLAKLGGRFEDGDYAIISGEDDRDESGVV